MNNQPSLDSVSSLLENDKLSQLNVFSLLTQAGYAYQDGNEQRAALLVGAALIAPKYKGASYLIQGALTANDLRQKLIKP